MSLKRDWRVYTDSQRNRVALWPGPGLALAWSVEVATGYPSPKRNVIEIIRWVYWIQLRTKLSKCPLVICAFFVSILEKRLTVELGIPTVIRAGCRLSSSSTTLLGRDATIAKPWASSRGPSKEVLISKDSNVTPTFSSAWQACESDGRAYRNSTCLERLRKKHAGGEEPMGWTISGNGRRYTLYCELVNLLILDTARTRRWLSFHHICIVAAPIVAAFEIWKKAISNGELQSATYPWSPSWKLTRSCHTGLNVGTSLRLMISISICPLTVKSSNDAAHKELNYSYAVMKF
jgi:hypothetical protein